MRPSCLQSIHEAFKSFDTRIIISPPVHVDDVVVPDGAECGPEWITDDEDPSALIHTLDDVSEGNIF